jgi:transcriptional regulator with XRE-family HTH domain
MSLAEVAQGICSRAAVHQFESGLARPSRIVLEQIAQRLGRPVEWFLAEARGEPSLGDVATMLRQASRRVEQMSRGDLPLLERTVLRRIAAGLRADSEIVAMIEHRESP